jgi:hypothetical protein
MVQREPIGPAKVRPSITAADPLRRATRLVGDAAGEGSIRAARAKGFADLQVIAGQREGGIVGNRRGAAAPPPGREVGRGCHRRRGEMGEAARRDRAVPTESFDGCAFTMISGNVIRIPVVQASIRGASCANSVNTEQRRARRKRRISVQASAPSAFSVAPCSCWLMIRRPEEVRRETPRPHGGPGVRRPSASPRTISRRRPASG